MQRSIGPTPELMGNMPLTHKQLLDLALDIWGPRWASRISEVTGINVRSIERMGSGKRPIAPDVAEFVEEMHERWRSS